VETKKSQGKEKMDCKADTLAEFAMREKIGGMEAVKVMTHNVRIESGGCGETRFGWHWVPLALPVFVTRPGQAIQHWQSQVAHRKQRTTLFFESLGAF